MLFRSTILSKASGSIAGIVASHNRFGMYFRARATPTNPQTARQQAIRTAVADLASRWSSSLTEAQRRGWDTYAVNVKKTNRLGEMRNLSGIDRYIGANVPRALRPMIRIDNAPQIFILPTFEDPIISTIAGFSQVQIDFPNPFQFPNNNDNGIMVYVSAPMRPSINWYRSGYIASEGFTGLDISVNNPVSVNTLIPFYSGSRAFVRIRYSSEDGRLSSPKYYRADTI